MIQHSSVREIVEVAEEVGLKISKLCLKDQAQQLDIAEEELYWEMEKDFDVMIETADWGQQPDRTSHSGLIGEEDHRIEQYAEHKGGLVGNPMTKIMACVPVVSNYSAAIGRIAAIPTAGSCGILSGCPVSIYEDRNSSKRDAVMPIFMAGALDTVIATNVCIANVQDGCQAEYGSAAGMAVAALIELMGGTSAQCVDALDVVIVNELDLTCDPAVGPVEILCIRRDAAGVTLAYVCTDVAFANIGLKIPVGECVTTMGEADDRMSFDLKETAGGGPAITPTGKRLREQVFGKEQAGERDHRIHGQQEGNMKRFVTWTLTLSLVFPLVACNGGRKMGTKSKTVVASETSGEAEKPSTIQPLQAVDKQDYDIRVDGYMMDETDDGSIFFILQNKNETVSYRFLLDSLTGDGVRLYGPINKVVEPGQEVPVQLPVRTNSNYKLQDFGNLEFRFLVQDSKFSVYTPEKNEVFHIYPNGENSKAHYTWKEEESDKLLDENAYFKATNTSVTKDKYDNHVLNLYFENRSDKPITLYIQGGAVNSILVEMSNYHVVGVGQIASIPIFWDHSYVEDTKVEEIQNLSPNLFTNEGDTFVMSKHPALEKTYTVEP